ncbi:L-lactate permease [Flavobacterium sp. H4147]|uniref:L-lactate permease n=1 Tax=Flavobacterium sp. H4147 TaxID=3034149 RepID=UPI0023EC7676|nr:L-lactate permease [Flavobacterium sp. H4147]
METETAEKSNFQEIPDRKIYSQKAIRVGTFLGGPFVSAYFLTENFKTFNDFDKVTKTWLITIITAVITFTIASLIPEDINFPNIIFPLIYMMIAGYFTKKYQEKDINEHLKNGGEEFGWARTIGISILALIPTFVFLFTLVFIISLLKV